MEFLIHRKYLQKAILAFLYGALLATSYADDDEVDNSKRQRTDSQPVITMDNNIQKSSGLKTVIVLSSKHQTEYEVFGKIISIEPLLALRERYLVAEAELAGAKARLKQAENSLRRQQSLFQNGVAAKRSMQDQEMQVQTGQAIADASQARLLKVTNEARLLWGSKLADLALSARENTLGEFLSGKQFLLQIILPTDKQLAGNVKTIFVEPNGNRDQAVASVLFSQAAQVDNAIPGENYFFLVNSEKLRTGMKITAWIPEPIGSTSGVIVPASALIWYMDQVYVYVKAGNDTFIRRLIRSFSPTPEGYFVEDGLNPGDEVVATGGQMLLSEELRAQIPDED